MNSLIYVRGVTKPISVSKQEALKVKNIWENESVEPDFVISLGKIHFQKRDIKFIEENNDVSRNENWNKITEDFYREERKNYEIESKWPAEKKASFLEIFKMIYFSSCNEQPSEETCKKAYEIQLEFFKKNPRRRVCDFNVLSSLIPRLRDKLGEFHISGIHLLEKIIFRDMQLSGQFDSKGNNLKVIQKTGDESISEMKEIAREIRNEDKEFNEMILCAVKKF